MGRARALEVMLSAEECVTRATVTCSTRSTTSTAASKSSEFKSGGRFVDWLLGETSVLSRRPMPGPLLSALVVGF
jgi:hypothetical protein